MSSVASHTPVWAEITEAKAWSLCEANKPPMLPPYAGYAKTLADGRIIRCGRGEGIGKHRWEITQSAISKATGGQL